MLAIQTAEDKSILGPHGVRFHIEQMLIVQRSQSMIAKATAAVLTVNHRVTAHTTCCQNESIASMHALAGRDLSWRLVGWKLPIQTTGTTTFTGRPIRS